MRFLKFALFAIIVTERQNVAACPFCASETAEVVRSAIFNDQFWLNIGSVLAPWFLLAAAVVWLPAKLAIGRRQSQ